MKNEKTRVDDAFAYDRNVVEHVLSLLESCRSVDVSTELCSDALEPVEERLAREVLCTVEAHMLEEVCETVLVVLLLECSYVSSEVELGSLSRLVVVTDVVGHAVLELAYFHCRVIRKCLWLLTERYSCSKNCCQKDKYTFHSLLCVIIPYITCKYNKIIGPHNDLVYTLPYRV